MNKDGNRDKYYKSYLLGKQKYILNRLFLFFVTITPQNLILKQTTLIRLKSINCTYFFSKL